MSCGSVLLVLAVLFVGLAYYLYTPFPEDAVEPHKQMFMSVLASTMLKMCRAAEYIGWKSYVQCVRSMKKGTKLSDEHLEVSDELFDGVKVRLYVPRGHDPKRPLPGMVYIHGGGWMFGSLEAYDTLVRTIATSLPAVIASVDYRLAPEHPFPVPFEDCVKATRYFMQNADKFGVDAKHIAVTGDSAGGNLAMAVGTKLTEERSPPRLLGLIYPALQMADFNTPSYTTFTTMPYLLQKRLMVEFYITYAFGNTNDIDKYLSNQHISPKLSKELKSKVGVELLPQKYQSLRVQGKDNTVDKALSEKAENVITNKYLCPLMLEDDELYELPKSYLLTCEYDPLRDDGLMLAKRWKDMGFPVKHVHWNGIQHGFFPQGDLYNTANKAVNDFLVYLRAEL